MKDERNSGFSPSPLSHPGRVNNGPIHLSGFVHTPGSPRVFIQPRKVSEDTCKIRSLKGNTNGQSENNGVMESLDTTTC